MNSLNILLGKSKRGITMPKQIVLIPPAPISAHDSDKRKLVILNFLGEEATGYTARFTRKDAPSKTFDDTTSLPTTDAGRSIYVHYGNLPDDKNWKGKVLTLELIKAPDTIESVPGQVVNVAP
jgi:hypothetical protein